MYIRESEGPKMDISGRASRQANNLKRALSVREKGGSKRTQVSELRRRRGTADGGTPQPPQKKKVFQKNAKLNGKHSKRHGGRTSIGPTAEGSRGQREGGQRVKLRKWVET